jgi:murein DD-endopeptidase MepM/ murein hydrolase activator NlpD
MDVVTWRPARPPRRALLAALLLAAAVSAPAGPHAAAHPQEPGPPGAAAHADRSTGAPAALAGRAVLPVDGVVLRPFAAPATPYGPGHRGVDLAAKPGTPVRAALPGAVTFAGPVAGRGWVTVAHGGGLDTTYGWIDPRRVRRGDRVAAGEVLGRLAADASHLDWGARLHGDYLDPLTLLGPWRARLVPVAP